MNVILAIAVEVPKFVFCVIVGAVAGLGSTGKDVYELVMGPPETCATAQAGAGEAPPHPKEKCAKAEKLTEAP